MLKGPEYATSSQKRAFDLCVASALVLPASIALASVKFALRGTDMPAIIHHERVGQNAELFEMLKLHTIDEDTRLPLFKYAELIRSLGIDELIQVGNILKPKPDMGIRGYRGIFGNEHNEVMANLSPIQKRDRLYMMAHERPGDIGSYALWHHTHEEGPDDFVIRHELDQKDFIDGSLVYDANMLLQFASMAISRRLG